MSIELNELKGREHEWDFSLLSSRLLMKRTDRPDEWSMDEFAGMALTLELRAQKAEVELQRMSDDLDTLHGVKEEYRHKCDRASKAFKWLDAYWATDPDAPLKKICPVCSRDSDEYDCDQCHDNAWDHYTKARKELEK